MFFLINKYIEWLKIKLLFYYKFALISTMSQYKLFNFVRLEIGTRHDELRARQGETFIYAWWFFLSSTVQPAVSFFHIFQLKASGDGVNPNPTMTFGLRKSNGFWDFLH